MHLCIRDLQHLHVLAHILPTGLVSRSLLRTGRLRDGFLMADSAAFAHVSNALESATSFSRIEARGTIRLALKSAGLSANSVTPEQIRVVIERVLPVELENRGIPDPESVCRAIARGLAAIASEASSDTPESVFHRLGGS